MSDYCGFQRETGDAVIGASGRPVAIYAVYIDSGSGGAGSVVLRDGTAATDDAVLTLAGSAANATENFPLTGGKGVVFPNGCFVDIGSNTDAYTIFYESVGV